LDKFDWLKKGAGYKPRIWSVNHSIGWLARIPFFLINRRIEKDRVSVEFPLVFSLAV
jgi:hypothetical protein